MKSWWVKFWWVLAGIAWLAMFADVTVAQRRGRPQVTYYTLDGCSPCIQFKNELFNGKFDNLGAVWVEHNVSRMGSPPDFTAAPSFRVNDGPIILVNPYSGQKVYNELYDQIFVPAAKPLEPSKLDPRSSRSNPSQVPVPAAAGAAKNANQQYSPTGELAPGEPAIDIDWSGVRFGVLVTDGAPVTVGMLRGPTQSLLDIASGGQCRLEIIHESTHPKQFAAVCDALEIEPYTVFKDIYPFMTIDKVANVNLFRGMVLKKIEAAFDERIHGEEMALVPDMIFRRVSEQRWQRVVMALDVRDDVQPKPKADADKVEEEKPEDHKPAHRVVAAVLGGLITMKLIRTVRALWWGQKEALLDQMAGESGEVAAGAAPVAAPSPVVASPVPARPAPPAAVPVAAAVPVVQAPVSPAAHPPGT